MFLGILIGMFLFGLLLLVSNFDDHMSPQTRKTRTFLRQIGWFFILTGFCGAVGRIIEVVVS